MFDVIVVGAGHAGCEAAWIASKLHKQVLLLTISLDTIAQMSCNPAIGGRAKSHLVYELDILGGIMANIIDKTGIQFKMLNTNKGPAVRALRAQADKKKYNQKMKERLETNTNIFIKQEMVNEILTNKNNTFVIKTSRNNLYHSKTVVITTGTFMNGLIHIGTYQEDMGRMVEPAAKNISLSLKKLGIKLGRLKTGTPPRISANTIDFSKCEEHPGDIGLKGFSYGPLRNKKNYIKCYITKTNQKTHDIIKTNINNAPIFSGQIKGIGPRYCSSIEDKIIKFPEKGSHQIFLEPEGLHTKEYYVNGFPTSLPENIQQKALNSITGLEKAEIMRPGYAIEYDYIFPNQINHALESKTIAGLFFAGQINGTSGYEEAAAQGLMAGINASRKIALQEPFILSRSESYIGVLIDDLINKTLDEPYRMFTSRAEHRILLREDNVDLRLMKYSRKLKTIRSCYEKRYKRNLRSLRDLLQFLRKSNAPDTLLKHIDYKKRNKPKLSELLKMPQINMEIIQPFVPEINNFKADIQKKAEYRILYQGYIKRSKQEVFQLKQQEKILIPNDINYNEITSIRKEARQKLEKIRPKTLGQAASISGVNPTDITILRIMIKKQCFT